MNARALVLAAILPIALGAQDTTAAKASLLAADRAAAGSETALAAALDPRATVLLPGLDILTGTRAFAPHLADMARGADVGPGSSPMHAVVSRDGSLGCTTGLLHRLPADTTQSWTGRYAACWRREREGTWRLLALSRVDAPFAVKALPDSLPGAPGSVGTVARRGENIARAMTDADRAFARFSADSGGPAGAFARWIAEDGMMLGARAVPVRGPAQARTAFAGFPAAGRFEFGPIDTLTGASRDGSLGFTIGEARIAPAPGAVSFSKYLTVWRREGDGRYRFVFDIGSERPAPGPH